MAGPYTHPVAGLGYDELEALLNSHVAEGAVDKKRCPEHGNYVLYNYKSVVKTKWVTTMLCARGIVLDPTAKRIVALPFPKFFNHNEHPPKKWGEVHTVAEKYDGSLGIVYWDGYMHKWRVNTRGSFRSRESEIGLDLLTRNHKLDALPKEWTVLVEILGPDNRIVVKYDTSHIRLLGAYHTERRVEPSIENLRKVAAAANFELGFHDKFGGDIAAIKESLDEIKGHEQEGWVVQFKDGSRRKFKGQSYIMLHRSKSDVTPTRVWQILSTCKTVAEARATIDEHANTIPEEHYDDLIAMAAKIISSVEEIGAQLNADVEATKAMDARELGLTIKKPEDFRFELPAGARHLLFAARNKPWDQAALWKFVQPKRK